MPNASLLPPAPDGNPHVLDAPVRAEVDPNEVLFRGGPAGGCFALLLLGEGDELP